MKSTTGRASRMRRATTADQIKQLILTRGLTPGDPLPTEAELCEELDVSRSSVREAIRTLSTLDIVDVRHGHGTYVGPMSLDPMVEALVFRGVLSPEGSLQALREVVEVRLALDLSMAERVVEAAQAQADPELDELVAEMVDKAGRGEYFLDEDRAFHTRLFGAIDNRLVGQLVGAFWTCTPPCSRSSASRSPTTSTRPPRRTVTCWTPRAPATSSATARPSSSTTSRCSGCWRPRRTCGPELRSR